MTDQREVLAAHRAFYDAVESGDVDLMKSLWVDDQATSCIHPGAAPLNGTATVLRSWTIVMAGVRYIQFFLTDVSVALFPDASSAEVAVVICTENILSDGETVESFTGGTAICTTVLKRDHGRWLIWSRHASPVALVSEENS